MTAYTARALSTDRLQVAVTQATHGFKVGHVVCRNTVGTTNWKLAQADSLANSQGACMVSYVIDANTFVVTQEGYVPNIVDAAITSIPFTDGVELYLDPVNPGQLTNVAPAGVGQVLLPCFVADSTSSGYFFGGTGDLIQSGTIFAWSTKIANATMAIQNGYLVNGAGSIDLLLPAASVVGDVVKVATLGVNGVRITQAAGQYINIVDSTSTVGVGGRLDLSPSGGVLSGSVELLCTVANLGWKVVNGTGIWTPV